MPAPVFTQSTQEALSLLEKAEGVKQALQVTPRGNVKILHQKPGQLPASKLVVVQAVLNKMQNEANALGLLGPDQSGPNVLGFLSLRMPSLNSFAVTGKLGNLREEWQQIRQELEQPERLKEEAFMKFSQVQNERLKVVHDMSQVLPIGFDISIEDGATSTLDHVFSESAQNELLDCCRTALRGVVIDRATGMVNQTLKDLHRQQMSFIIESLAVPSSKGNAISDNDAKLTETKKEFSTGKKEEKLTALMEVAQNNKVVANTLSGVLNQDIFKVMGYLFNKDNPTPSGDVCITGQPEKKDEVQLYTLRRRADNDFELTLLRLRQTEKLISMDGQQEWKINSADQFQQELSENNFGEKQVIKLFLKNSDLEKGVLNPSFIEPPVQSLCISPDFKDIIKRAAGKRPMQP